MKRIWMLCLLTALLHSAAYAAKPNAKNPAKGEPAVEESDKTHTDGKAPVDEAKEEEKDLPEPKKKEPNQDR